MRFLVVFLISACSWAALPSREVAQGNKAAQSGQFDDAQYHYVKALENHADTSTVMYNLGNVLYSAGEYERAKQLYGASLDSMRSNEQLANSFYNMGNAGLQAQKYDEAIASYIEALRHDPEDSDARENLELALRLKKQSEQQQQDQQQDQQKQDQQQDQQQQNEQQQEQQQNQEQQNQEQQQQQQQQQQDQQEQQQQQRQAQPQQMSKEEAEQLLNALLQNEQNTIEQVRKVKSDKRKKRSKDW